MGARLSRPKGKRRAGGNRVRRRVMTLVAVVACGICSSTFAFEIDTGTDAHLRWDNTVKYSAAWRVENRSHRLLENVNTDDGDRDFDPGLISNRFDLLSELDLSYHKVGMRLSGAGWYDEVYQEKNDNNSPATANAFSVPYNEFTDDTRRLHGGKAEILDAFVFAKGRIGGVPGTIRIGRHTLLWGESLLMADNGISYGQAPLDLIKALSVPGTQAKELFMPVTQISGQLRPSASLSFEAYYQFEWRKTRLPAAGSYFSSADFLDAGGERLFVVAPTTAFFRAPDLSAEDLGQWGLAMRYWAESINTEFGLYYLRYHDKLPQLYLRPGAGADLAIGKIGEYSLVYPEDIQAFGASFATTVGSVSLAGEAHLRWNMPLVSIPQTATAAADNRNHPLYAVGNTLHAQVSAIYVAPTTPLWDSATLLAEVGGQKLLSFTKNRDAFDPERDRYAYGISTVFTPTYYQVRPNLDLSVPLSLTYNPKGRSPVAGFNGGVDRGGTLSIGLTAVYRNVWITGLQFTHYYGSIGGFQTLKDRDFVSFSLQRTF